VSVFIAHFPCFLSAVAGPGVGNKQKPLPAESTTDNEEDGADEAEAEENLEEDSKPSAEVPEDLAAKFERSASLLDNRAGRNIMSFTPVNWKDAKDFANIYAWKDGNTQDHCSADIMVPGADSDWFDVQVSKDQEHLILKKRLPKCMLNAGRLVTKKIEKATARRAVNQDLENDAALAAARPPVNITEPHIPTRKALLDHAQVVSLIAISDKFKESGVEVRMVGDEETYWISQSHKLPFKVDLDLWRDPQGVDRWELMIFRAERGTDMDRDHQNIHVISVEMLSVVKPRPLPGIARTNAYADYTATGANAYEDPRADD
jgi:hypothetical protein